MQLSVSKAELALHQVVVDVYISETNVISGEIHTFLHFDKKGLLGVLDDRRYRRLLLAGVGGTEL
jgi:hypothetical protein